MDTYQYSKPQQISLQQPLQLPQPNLTRKLYPNNNGLTYTFVFKQRTSYIRVISNSFRIQELHKKKLSLLTPYDALFHLGNIVVKPPIDISYDNYHFLLKQTITKWDLIGKEKGIDYPIYIIGGRNELEYLKRGFNIMEDLEQHSTYLSSLGYSCARNIITDQKGIHNTHLTLDINIKAKPYQIDKSTKTITIAPTTTHYENCCYEIGVDKKDHCYVKTI